MWSWLRIAATRPQTSPLPLTREVDMNNPFSFAAFPSWKRVFADINKDRRVKIPAGKHTIMMDNVAGDWVKYDSITFTNAVSSRYPNLMALALQDPTETLLWLYDEQSNWKNDRDNMVPTEQQGVSVAVPVKRDGNYEVQWWDTRAGKTIGSSTVPS